MLHLPICTARLAGPLLSLLLGILPVMAQEPVASEVVVDHIAATVLEPAGVTARNGVVIIAGSGATDRNGNGIGGLNTDAYKRLAEALAKAGIASVRYDKRGVGASKRDPAGEDIAEAKLTIADFVADAARMSRWLAKRPGVTSVSLIGHSEGGLIASLAAKEAGARRLVVLTAPGRPFGVILRMQLDRQALPVELREDIDRVLGALEAGSEIGSVPAPLQGLFRPSVQPFLRSIVTLDPAKLLAAAGLPTLIVGGGNDIQIGRLDFNALVEARAGAASLWLPRMTHTLKEVSDDDPAQAKAYTDPSLPLMPGLADRLASFLQE